MLPTVTLLVLSFLIVLYLYASAAAALRDFRAAQPRRDRHARALAIEEAADVLDTGRHYPADMLADALRIRAERIRRGCPVPVPAAVPIAPPVGTPYSGALAILQERGRQIDAEGWTPEHDASHTVGELRHAAVAYLVAAAVADRGETPGNPPPHMWPWSWSWWKPSTDPVRNLVKAGALIAAEIDRLTRQRRSPSPVVLAADAYRRTRDERADAREAERHSMPDEADQ